MSGFDVAAGAVGFASLGVLLLQGCVQGFILLSTAQDFGQDADLMRCEVEFEQYRLFKWTEKAGLAEDLVPVQNLNWQVVHKLLRQLSSLMSETADFKKEYGLEIITTEEQLSASDLDVPRKGLRKLIAIVKPEFHNETARNLQKGVRIWKRLKWAGIDKAGVALLLNDIRGLIDKLYDLLLEGDREFVRNGIEALLRHIVSQAKTSSELANIEQLLSPKHSARSKFEEGAVATAIRMKQKRLMLGFTEESTPGVSSSNTSLSPSTSSSTLLDSSSPIPRKSLVTRPIVRGPLSFRLLKRTTGQVDTSREMALYDSQPVLVEWKVIERSLVGKLKHRVKSLAALLQDIESPSFRSLNCLGYLKDPGTGNYGYVFKLPKGDPQSLMSLTCLLISDTIIPSLTHRIGMSAALAETVLQLHTSGWLHKGMRSDNILFFPSENMAADLLCPFLEGYEYARADNPSDVTESPALQQEANLYRHPALLRTDRASFKKAFDLYGLGCIFIEIALWSNMTSIFLHFLRKEKKSAGHIQTRLPSTNLHYDNKPEMADVNNSRHRLLLARGSGSIMEALEFAVGMKFAGIVQVCLSAGDASGAEDADEEDEDEDTEDAIIDVELDIVRELKSCVV